MIYLLITNGILLLILILILLTKNDKKHLEQVKTDMLEKFTSLEFNTREEFKRNRGENADSDQRNRRELTETLRQSLSDFAQSFDRSVRSFNEIQKEKFGNLETRQQDLIQHTETKLEFIRAVVEEKLEQTLNERLKQSFSTVSTQLTDVQRGLGEMKVLANDVGGLKKVLSNVKMRGGFGEIQLSMLLEQLLSPEQYQANVKTKSGSNDSVEFAIRLPGKSDLQESIWLPVDAKFPKDVYEKLQHAYDEGDPSEITQAQKELFNTIKKMGKDICSKYIDPPNTTDFAIMFLPFEGIFAEVIRQAGLLEEMQRDCKVIVTGPTTLGAILNSLQMGFKTLAIQKRSSEVWQILGEVKNEFEKFGGMLGKAQANIQTGLNQLDNVIGVRTRAIQRRLKKIESIPDQTGVINDQISESDDVEDQDDEDEKS